MLAGIFLPAKDLATRSPVDPVLIAVGVCLGKLVTMALLGDLDETSMLFGRDNAIDAKQVVFDPVSIPEPEGHFLRIAAGHELICEFNDLLEFRLIRNHNYPRQLRNAIAPSVL